MKNKLVFALHGNRTIAESLCKRLDFKMGDFDIRKFPDGETYIRVNEDLSGNDIIIVCTLNQPDEKLLPLYFLSRTLRDLGSGKITLVTPYLAYMRQDKRFKPGEGITSDYFAKLISGFVDKIITVDPHLHRHTTLSEIYTIPTAVLHAAGLISDWTRENIDTPLLIGPDSESEQWVSAVAEKAGAPYVILDKKRQGDKQVEISFPSLEKYTNHTPVPVDDIISTAGTMMKTVAQLKSLGMKPAVCVGVHAVFAKNAFMALKESGAHRIITCNTIPHESNEIDISGLIAEEIRKQ